MVSALDSVSSVLGWRPGWGTALCSWATHCTSIVEVMGSNPIQA